MAKFTRTLSKSLQAKLKTNPVEENLHTNELKIRLGDNFATVTYEKVNNSTYDLVHSSIPEMYQGHGLGAILAERVFDHLIEGNKKFRVTCEYLQKFVSKSGNKYDKNIID